ncbi:Site-specific recombinase XerD [Rubritalea squalenifaciens DSM 18772]|uniref:Site-specific recombinase XerD n=1 Tax=Rubritalea squalenifaciens DSM 18772 TaxID=1123071 RepID=A0A1M6GUD8_9BACT|nr:site-specific integrase [Rubritalea squalenifaciens]SHJ13608.1 Site-specific recombinase XerD [Rubritalea squalenifaciens DSM 18772]
MSEASKITLKKRPYQYQAANGKYYTTFIVQGWKENGKWQRKQFKSEKDADVFIADKTLELNNDQAAKRSRQTTLTEEQLDEAEKAFKALGSTYNLSEVVSFFLDNHRPPEFALPLTEAIEIYLEDQAETLRPRTLIQKRSSLKLFYEHVGDVPVHECTQQKVLSFLKALRAKDGISKASRKTWNNYRNDLNHFFAWSGEKDMSTNRPWLFVNPVEGVRIFTAKQVAEQRKPIATTDPKQVAALFTHLMEDCPELVKYYALAYFAGIRPSGEMKALDQYAEEDGLIDLKTRTINITAKISKTKEERKVHISENLAQWLTAFAEYPIIPKNFDRMNKAVRAKFKLQHDETRHSFISYHVAVHRSAGDAALQAGNSESIVKKHYLRHSPAEDGNEFFSLIPCSKTNSAIQSNLRLDNFRYRAI